MLPLKPFYLIRHGQTEANVARITSGGKNDTPLTDEGRRQARALAPYLKSLSPAPGKIFHSDLQRARETAAILNESLNLPMEEVGALRERDFGSWEGKPWDETLPLLEARVCCSGGETERAFAERLHAALEAILNQSTPQSPPLIVAHGGTFHAVGFLYEYGMSEVQNCHLHLFEPQPEQPLFPWRIWKFDPQDGILVKTLVPFDEALSRNGNHNRKKASAK